QGRGAGEAEGGGAVAAAQGVFGGREIRGQVVAEIGGRCIAAGAAPQGVGRGRQAAAQAGGGDGLGAAAGLAGSPLGQLHLGQNQRRSGRERVEAAQPCAAQGSGRALAGAGDLAAEGQRRGEVDVGGQRAQVVAAAAP